MAGRKEQERRKAAVGNAVVRGAAFVEHRTRGHKLEEACPVCFKDCMRIGITKLVYSYEVCRCDAVPYAHLLERLWHRECFINAKGAVPASA